MGGELLAKFSSFKEHKNSFSCSEINKLDQTEKL